MVFGDEQFSLHNLFISSPELLDNEHGFVTLNWSLKVLVTNYFVTEWLYIYIYKKKKLVTHMFCHPMFYLLTKYFFLLSYWVTIHLKFLSPKDLCGDKLFFHQLFVFFFFLLSYGVMILFRHLKIYVVTNYFVTNYFYFIFYFFY